MSRSGKVSKRIISPDNIYNSRLVAKFINKVMVDGKKSISQKLVYNALASIEKTTGKNPLTIFEQALANVGPKMEVRPRRVGGASYQVPIEVRGIRREALAIKWIIAAARARSNKEYHTFDAKLTAELINASENKGAAVKKKEDIQRVAESNRAFAHFRWG